jgi:maltose alpha-D-glucosyltransferase/alpha-amylase
VSENRWYQDAVFYELRVRAFHDADGDGIGDFPGLAAKLDYLADLGVNAVWLLPFYPSPLRDDGYDISGYTEVHPENGTLQEFRALVREAHRRDIRIVTELVLNHTSDQHPWFQRARRDKAGGKWRDFYVWSDDPHRYREARIIFKDFETSNWAWDPVAEAYYWHRFYAHQPDLNYDNPAVQKAMLRVLDFWLELGVDGVRLDAVPYLYEREGTNCENLPETHAFLRRLRAHVERRFADRMLLAEANQWPEEAVTYFGAGDECHMAFHFPIMPRLFMALHMEDRYPLVDILHQTPPIPPAAQWALFLRNHDELTLEMVTDEERDYMYRVYAHDPQARINLGIRRRLAPLLGNDRRRIELMNGLLFSLPGTPIIYYGDEIGMGDNFYLGDRNGVRTPMQWSSDRNAGFSRANPQRLYLPVIIDPEYHYEAVNVEAQQANPHSLLWWMKRLIALRKRHPVFGRGTIDFLRPRNRKVLAFVRRWRDDVVLVVANLSRFVQFVELDLAAWKGMVAVELFGGTPFPRIGELPYLLTLAPHGFYWLALHHERRGVVRAAPPVIAVQDDWTVVLEDPAWDALAEALPRYLAGRRWFGGKAREVPAVALLDTAPLPLGEGKARITLIQAHYTDGPAETYQLVLGFATGERAAQVRGHAASAVIADLVVRGRRGETRGILYDAFEEKSVAAALLELVARRRRLRSDRGEVSGMRTRAFNRLRGSAAAGLEPRPLIADQSNSAMIYGDRFLLKLYRKVDEGVNPELEIGLTLTERGTFDHLPLAGGAIEYRAGRREVRTLALLQQYVSSEDDAWEYTLDEAARFFDRALIRHRAEPLHEPPPAGVLALRDTAPPPLAEETIGAYLETARLLGRRTAELHLALASVDDDSAFAPEPFSTLYQRSLYQSMRNLLHGVFHQLEERLGTLPDGARAEAERVRALEPRIERIFRSITTRKITALRIRHHGDYHLGQVLHTGRDVVIIDFEGEPARPISERRIKRSPLRDVAGMLRSFDYAVHHVLTTRVAGTILRVEDLPAFEPWAQFWQRWVSAVFLGAYFDTAGKARFLPKAREELELMLNVYLLEKAVYELGYELNHRPGWVWVPVKGIATLVESAPGGAGSA